MKIHSFTHFKYQFRNFDYNFKYYIHSNLYVTLLYCNHIIVQ